MQILIDVPDTLPIAVIQQRIKELEESLKKEARQAERRASKWGDMVLRIESKAFDLGSDTIAINQNREEFRKLFNFEG